MKNFIFSIALALILGLQGCAFIIGKHPGIHESAYRTYCYPCVQVENKGGIGLMWIHGRPALGYDYK